MARDKLFMESTKIDPLQTAGEVVSLLVQAGARQIQQEYSSDKKLVGVAFTLEILPGMVRYFKLPVRSEPIFKIINGGRKHYRGNYTTVDREQAERVAWRQLYRWIQAQLAMIEVGMVEAAEIFLPYMQNESGATLFQEFMANSQKLLGEGTSVQ